jgi:hypothetical protein
MELINRATRTYGPPATLDASEPEVDIRASYGPSPWVQQHVCYVRNVRVDKLALREGDNHVWCLFPDGRIMIVAEANIKAVKLKRS